MFPARPQSVLSDSRRSSADGVPAPIMGSEAFAQSLSLSAQTIYVRMLISCIPRGNRPASHRPREGECEREMQWKGTATERCIGAILMRVNLESDSVRLSVWKIESAAASALATLSLKLRSRARVCVCSSFISIFNSATPHAYRSPLVLHEDFQFILFVRTRFTQELRCVTADIRFGPLFHLLLLCFFAFCCCCVRSSFAFVAERLSAQRSAFDNRVDARSRSAMRSV